MGCPGWIWDTVAVDVSGRKRRQRQQRAHVGAHTLTGLGLRIPACIYVGSSYYFHHCGLGETCRLFSQFLDQSTIPICCHDNQHLAFAHVFKCGCQRDQVCIRLVTGFPQV